MLSDGVQPTIAVGQLGKSTLASNQLIVAHRGASHDAPENTLAAFRLAWECGADAIEGDFSLTSDGHVVCIHDANTGRVSDRSLVVAETPLGVLRSLDVGAWKGEKWRGEKIPTLEEVIDVVPRRGKLFIELKVGPEIVQPVAKALEASKLHAEQIVVLSFRADTIKSCKERMPRLRTHWLVRFERAEVGLWQPSASRVAETFMQIGANGLGSKALPEFVDRAFMDQFRVIGGNEFHIWVVNDLETANHFQRAGAWSIATDRPDWLRIVLRG